MKVIDCTILDSLTAHAKSSLRKRMNLNLHQWDGDTLQRLLNAFEPMSYVQPHRHANPGKREVFLVVRGRLLVVVFDDEGAIKEHIVLNRSNECYIAEVEACEWHTVVGLDSGSIAFEVKDGPYDPLTDKQFAPWAPAEHEPGAAEYLKKLLDQLNLF